jgi:hypothetical protein
VIVEEKERVRKNIGNEKKPSQENVSLHSLFKLEMCCILKKQSTNNIRINMHLKEKSIFF